MEEKLQLLREWIARSGSWQAQLPQGPLVDISVWEKKIFSYQPPEKGSTDER